MDGDASDPLGPVVQRARVVASFLATCGRTREATRLRAAIAKTQRGGPTAKRALDEIVRLAGDDELGALQVRGCGDASWRRRLDQLKRAARTAKIRLARPPGAGG